MSAFVNCPKCHRSIPLEDHEDHLTIECARCNTRFQVNRRQSSSHGITDPLPELEPNDLHPAVLPLSRPALCSAPAAQEPRPWREVPAPSVRRTKHLFGPWSRLGLGTKIGITLCIVPFSLLLFGVFWFVILGKYERRTSAAAAEQFLDDLLVAERVPLAYQRCSDTFRTTFPERRLYKYASMFPRDQMRDLTLVGTNLTISHREVQVAFSCRFPGIHRLFIHVNMSKCNGAWLVDGFAFSEP